jgi:adenylate cyclase
MIEKELAPLTSWIASVGLEGARETALVEGFCSRAVGAGLPLARAIVFIDTLHPIHEGRAFRWDRDKSEATVSDMGGAPKARLPNAGAEVRTTGCWKLANR